MTGSSGPRSSRAVLIGVARYDHPGLSPIPAAATNVTDLADALTGAAPRSRPNPDRVGEAVSKAARRSKVCSGYTTVTFLTLRNYYSTAVLSPNPDPGLLFRRTLVRCWGLGSNGAKNNEVRIAAGRAGGCVVGGAGQRVWCLAAGGV